jgi:hypothetical protein
MEVLNRIQRRNGPNLHEVRHSSMRNCLQQKTVVARELHLFKELWQRVFERRSAMG